LTFRGFSQKHTQLDLFEALGKNSQQLRTAGMNAMGLELTRGGDDGDK
jgi:hypothetical protein